MTAGGLDAAAVAIAISMLGVFAYHTLSLAVLIWGPEPLPEWLRVSFPRPAATGALRAVSLAWVIFMTIVSLVVTAWALMGRGIEPTFENRLVLFAEVLLLIGWTGFLVALYRRPQA